MSLGIIIKATFKKEKGCYISFIRNKKIILQRKNLDNI